jgi:hypothetical protein
MYLGIAFMLVEIKGYYYNFLTHELKLQQVLYIIMTCIRDTFKQ